MLVASVDCRQVTEKSATDAILRLTVLYPDLEFTFQNKRLVAEGTASGLDRKVITVTMSDQLLRSTYSEQTSDLRTALFGQLLS
jgi:hypothetical protein